MAPDDNCLPNARHVKFSFLLQTENTATVGSKLHVQFYPILKYACHFLHYYDFNSLFFFSVNCHSGLRVGSLEMF